MHMKSLLFSIAVCGLFLVSCDGCKNDCPANLEFYLSLQAYGIKDTLHLGDTLRIRLDISDKLAEINSGNTYDFIDYNFKLITYMVKIDSLPTISGIFNWTTIEGESISNGEIFRVLPLYSDHTYHYKVIITPKRKGLFVFGMNSTADRADKLEELDGPCSNRPVMRCLSFYI